MPYNQVTVESVSQFQKLVQTNKDRIGVGEIEMKKKKEQVIENANEGREKYFIDVDRMINEGLGGGTVSMRENSGEIEEARDFEPEAPPHEVNDEK